MKVKRESEVAQLWPTLSDPMDCSLPGSSVHGIFQARVLEWGAIAFFTNCVYGGLTQIKVVRERTDYFRGIGKCYTHKFSLYVYRGNSA